MTKVKRIGHVFMHTHNATEAAKFFEEGLGMTATYANPHMVFLSFGLEHHDIGLWQSPKGKELHNSEAIHHIALEIEGGEKELQKLYGRLVKAGAKIDSIRDHGVSRGVYFFDPVDGNRLEIFYNVLEDTDGPAWKKGEVQEGAQKYLFDTAGGGYQEVEIEPIFEEA